MRAQTEDDANMLYVLKYFVRSPFLSMTQFTAQISLELRQIATKFQYLNHSQKIGLLFTAGISQLVFI